ncbi:MAG: hypothetical protein IIA40_13565, partial [SAR324 cluster bacterium]|nr:hypothetical protein [SAR324 cluster bacterium]
NFACDISAGSGHTALTRDRAFTRKFCIDYADRILHGRDGFDNKHMTLLRSLDLPDDVFEKIVRLAQEGVTIMLVEQNAARALEISDRGYVLELGRNRFEGTGQELLDNQDVRRMYLGG